MARADDSRYNIGAVSRLSGVSREKIRIWERRYGAVTPTRDAGNHRLYSREDVERLSRIRTLVDRGHAISSVANLTLRELDDRIRDQQPEPAAGVAMPASALLVSAAGDDVAELLSNAGVEELERVADCASAIAWLADHQADLVVVEQPTLGAGDLPELVRLHRSAGPGRTLLLFRFAPRPLLEQLRTLGMQPVKAPLQPDDLGTPTSEEAEPAAPHERRYQPGDLRRIATLADRMLCECPRHLVDLINDLNAFEDYSLACQVESAADAAVHREIYDIVSRARSLVEDALTIVAEEHREP